MSEKIEQVARAIARLRFPADDIDQVFTSHFTNLTYSKVDLCRLEARAAIEAMREPNDFMLRESHATLHRETDGVIANTYRAMIDAALKD